MNRRGFFKGLGASLGWAILPTLPSFGVITIVRPLTAVWEFTPAATLATAYGMDDLEEELWMSMSKQIQETIDRDILNDLYVYAQSA